MILSTALLWLARAEAGSSDRVGNSERRYSGVRDSCHSGWCGYWSDSGAPVFNSIKIAAVIMGSVAVGAIVNSISGELSISWGFLVFDIGQVVIAAAVAMTLSAVWRNRRSHV